jgi:hypothetical protein
MVPDAGRIALEMGNSPEKLFTNYRELDRHGHAADWFALEPSARFTRKIIPLPIA